MTKEYTTQDLVESIKELYPENYPAQVGHLRNALWSVLTSVKISDPEMFKRIIEFEIKVSERLKKQKGY